MMLSIMANALQFYDKKADYMTRIAIDIQITFLWRYVLSYNFLASTEFMLAVILSVPLVMRGRGQEYQRRGRLLA